MGWEPVVGRTATYAETVKTGSSVDAVNPPSSLDNRNVPSRGLERVERRTGRQLCKHREWWLSQSVVSSLPPVICAGSQGAEILYS